MSDEFPLPLGNKDIQYLPIMEQYARGFTLLCELEALKRKLRDD